MSGRRPTLRQLSVAVEADYILVESLTEPGTSLAVSRRPGELSVSRQATADVSNGKPASTFSIDLIFGVFHLLRGAYLAVVTESALAGRAFINARFFQVLSVELIPIDAASAVNNLTPAQRRDENRYINMIKNVFRTRSFYFSDSYEITNSLQRASGGDAGQPEWRRADPRFMWNYHALGPLMDSSSDCAEWIVPVMNGLVKVVPGMEAAGKVFDLVFFSRRAARRQGTRFNVRGVDEDGSVANYVETEQILAHRDNSVTSYVQARGSIPLYWTQYVDMRYMPRVRYPRSEVQSQAGLARHAADMVNAYDGKVICVNLIDRKGDQLRLGQAFEAGVKKLNSPDFQFIWFDFHGECKKMRWHNLAKLMHLVQDEFDSMGYFHRAADGTVTQEQKGVFRTNCMDNLDRTNVVQSLLARRACMLSLGALGQATDVLNSPFPLFEDAFKGIWTDNANCLGLLYTGTGALKTDFTRTGKRTIMGALDDGWRSVKRYFINNLVDGRVQDQWDLFLGKYTPDTVGPSKLDEARKEETPTSFLRKVGLLLVSVTALVASAVPMVVSADEVDMVGGWSWTSRWATGAMVASGLFAVVSFLQLKKGIGCGKRLVSRPHLVPHVDEDVG